MLGVIHIGGKHQYIYKDKDGYFYVVEESVDIGTTLRSHIAEMQSILNEHPDASIEYEHGWGDHSNVVIRYKIYVDPNDDRIIKLLAKIKADDEKKKLKQKEHDQKILKEIKKRSPDLFK